MKRIWIYGAIVFGILLVIFGISRFGYLGSSSRNIIPAQVVPDVVAPVAPPVDETPQFHYIEIIDGCDYAFAGTCVNVRSGPGTKYDVVMRLRTGIVLKVESQTVSGDGFEWYKVVFDKELWHPERVTSDWYVAAVDGSVRSFTDPGEVQLGPKEVVPPTDKRIVVNLTDEMLYAYEGDTLFMQESISTGIGSNPTVPGTFTIYRKTPSRYMQGPLPDGGVDEVYDLPGVAWDLYFTTDGAVLHAAYWHDSFGQPMSHGCVNQRPGDAKRLYYWADLGTKVIVEK